MAEIEPVEISAMLAGIKQMTEPKKVLRALAEARPIFTVDEKDVYNIKLKTYMIWLKTYNQDWFEFFKSSVLAMSKIFSGRMIGEDDVNDLKALKEPEGWLVPYEYFGGKAPEVKSSGEEECPKCHRISKHFRRYMPQETPHAEQRKWKNRMICASCYSKLTK